MTHYACLGCILAEGYPNYYRQAAQHELQICCCCHRETREWLPCTLAAGSTDADVPCAAVHLADVM